MSSKLTPYTPSVSITKFIAAIKEDNFTLIQEYTHEGFFYYGIHGIHIIEAAAMYGRLDMIKYFIAQGANFIQSNESIALALEHRHRDIMKYLIGKGVPSNQLCNHDTYELHDKSITVLHCELMKLTSTNHLRYLVLLLEAYFLYSDYTPYDYIIDCPPWHKPYALKFANS